jgi:hypothetical protein
LATSKISISYSNFFSIKFIFESTNSFHKFSISSENFLKVAEVMAVPVISNEHCNNSGIPFALYVFSSSTLSLEITVFIGIFSAI